MLYRNPLVVLALLSTLSFATPLATPNESYTFSQHQADVRFQRPYDDFLNPEHIALDVTHSLQDDTRLQIRITLLLKDSELEQALNLYEKIKKSLLLKGHEASLCLNNEKPLSENSHDLRLSLRFNVEKDASTLSKVLEPLHLEDSVVKQLMEFLNKHLESKNLSVTNKKETHYRSRWTPTVLD